jgi:uncharacterized peroxidase-related enzyme
LTRDEERMERATQPPLVGGLPDAPGISAAMALSPDLGVHLRGLADALLVDDFPGATLRRAEREMIATVTSAGNDCFYCMDSHAAFASELLDRDGDTARKPLVDELLVGALDGFDPKMRALLNVASVVRRNPLELSAADVEAATSAGATDGDVQLAVCIASAFSMYNRLVDGLRAMTPPSTEPYAEPARRIAEHGYSRAAATSDVPPR